MGLDPKATEGTILVRFAKFLTDLIEKPVVWFRENVVVPNRQEYPWYHEKVRRVPTVDECYTNDVVCIFEAEEQFKRDRMIDANIVRILKKRLETCLIQNKPDQNEICEPLRQQWRNAHTNFFIKYGDLGYPAGAVAAYMKQKHRMIWERRHGPVGSGRKDEVTENN